MQEAIITALLWLGFGGTHVGLTVPPIRSRLVRALGQSGYVLVFSLVAIGTFASLIHYVALHRLDVAHATLFTTIPPVRGALVAISVFGFSLLIAAVVMYPGAPMAAFRHRAIPVRGIQQISRHPFFSGVALWAAAHALLSPSSVSFVFFFGAIVFSFAGSMHQDRRLIAELGEPYRSYVASTSFWPFVAVATKRQRIRWPEQPWLAYAIGIGASLGLYRVHDHIFDHGGAYVIGVVTVGSFFALLSAKARSAKRRKGARDV